MAPVTIGTAAPWSPAHSKATALDFLSVASPLYARVEEALAPSGLSYAEYRLLDGLRHRSPPVEGHRPQGGAGRPVGSRRGEAMEALQARGLVRIAPVASGRAIHRELTPLGLARVSVAADRLDALVADFASRLDMSEAVGLSDLLARLAPECAGAPGTVGTARQTSG